MKTEIDFVSALPTANIALFGESMRKGSAAFEDAKADIISAGVTLKMVDIEKFSENNIICSTIFDALTLKMPKAEQALAVATSKEREAMSETQKKKAEALNKKCRRWTMALIAGVRGQLSGAPTAEGERQVRVAKSQYERELETMEKFQKKHSNMKEPTSQDVAIAAFWTKTIDLYKASFKPEA